MDRAGGPAAGGADQPAQHIGGAPGRSPGALPDTRGHGAGRHPARPPRADLADRRGQAGAAGPDPAPPLGQEQPPTARPRRRQRRLAGAPEHPGRAERCPRAGVAACRRHRQGGGAADAGRSRRPHAGGGGDGRRGRGAGAVGHGSAVSPADDIHPGEGEPAPWVVPDPEDPRLTRLVAGRDHTGAAIEVAVTMERPLTLFLNSREIVTMMTIGDHPDYLALGYLLNQNMLGPEDRVLGVEYDDDTETVVVRTERETDFEDKLRKKTLTSGCAQGTVFGDVMEKFETIRLPAEARLRTSWLYALVRTINALPSLYLTAGAIHGCVLCCEDRPLVYMEDVGRHNAVDKVAGYMRVHGVEPADKIFYTTGRLTSEMVIKTVQMGIPILISRSGFTAWGVELARRAGLTLVGRAKGRRFVVLSGAERLVYDADLSAVDEEHHRHHRKSARDDDV
ncbi:MAG: formate dehydrogenase accessory sulfurtransferase FdhD [Rhodospirillaceae bacterium]|nr:formate dehydrogenase accessory sulfurtransferase FdhD [Rhodospirillaceae bacterium]